MNDCHALQLDGLSKRFGRHVAVDSLSLSVRPGEMVGFLGPNGAGKSTTLYMVTGLVRPTSGRAFVFGHDVRRDFVRAMGAVGAMVESPVFHPGLSARTNLRMVARARGIRGGNPVLDACLSGVGLFSRARDKVGTYSQGMKQRLGLAACFLGSPRLLLLDEPTNGLDPEAMRDILSMVRLRVDEEGVAVFLSSHLLSEVEEFCDRVIIMNRGRLVTEGLVGEILAPHGDWFRVTLSVDSPPVARLHSLEGIASATESEGDVEIRLREGFDGTWLTRVLVERGFGICALVPKRRSLREFFFSTTRGTVDVEAGAPAGGCGDD